LRRVCHDGGRYEECAVVTDLAGTQLSSLLEALPGIAKVLRSPVADAFIGLIRAASGQAPFRMADAEEVMRYAVRRSLLTQEESDRVLADAVAALEAAATKAKVSAKPRARAKTKPAKQVSSPRPRGGQGTKSAQAAKPRLAARKPGRVARKK
jgi:hypothetical protein